MEQPPELPPSKPKVQSVFQNKSSLSGVSSACVCFYGKLFL